MAPAGGGEKGGPSGQNRTADEPGQTLNVDLCFVPAVHEAAQRLPAVSGSSGRLVVSGLRPRVGDAAHTWPGQVFEDAEMPYGAAMRAFVHRSAPRTRRRTPARTARRQRQEQEAAEQEAAEQEAAEQEAAEQGARRARREQRRSRAAQWAQVLQRRQREDAAWQAVSRDRRARLRPARWTPSSWAAYVTAEDHYQVVRAQRQATLAQRQQEEAQWLAEAEQVQASLAPPAAKPPWIAILVLTDNCTRRCLGLPLFAVGPKVTAEEVIAALRVLLPDELQFLISDRGTHFTAHPFAEFAREEDFVHVLIARHRPQSNGIAERFVRTLKEWLAARAWDGVAALELLLEQVRAEYNDRPHQGLALPGLSPNEFAARLWLL